MKAIFTKEQTSETKAKITISHYIYPLDYSGDLIVVESEWYSNTSDWYQNIETAEKMYSVESMQIWELKIFK